MGNAKIIPTDREAIFLPYQSQWILDGHRLKLIEKSRQIGLSWGTAYRAVEVTTQQDARFDQWVSSRDDLQARLFLEDCKTFAKVFKIAADDLGEMIIDPERKITAYVLHFANGRRIHSMSSNPDAQAGKRGGRILDEFALHPDPRKLWAIAYPGITWGGNMEIISTHRGSDNFFNQLVREVREGNNPKGISLHRVRLQDALEQGFLFKLQEKLHPDDPIQVMDESAYFDFIKNGCADEESFQQEYCCNPADDNIAFLSYELITQNEYPAHEPWEYNLDGLIAKRGNLYAGIDIGRTKDLTVMWILERLGDVLYTRKIITLANMSKPQQELILAPYIALTRRVNYDYTGLGIGWGDDALATYGEGKIGLITFSARTKEELAYPVRGALEDRRLRIPADGKIRGDLRSVTKVTGVGGNIRFTAERTPDGHADRFWALALAVDAAQSSRTVCEGLVTDEQRGALFEDTYSRHS